MGIISDLIKDIQNRPRIFDFRSLTTALQGPTGYDPIRAKPSTVSTTEEPAAPYHNPRGNLPTSEVPKGAVAISRELGQYPGIHPEYENISNPYEWHQQMISAEIAKAKAYNDLKTASSPFNIRNEYSPEPAGSSHGPNQLPASIYNRNVSFR